MAKERTKTQQSSILTLVFQRGTKRLRRKLMKANHIVKRVAVARAQQHFADKVTP